jgi:hypothetical protein
MQQIINKNVISLKAVTLNNLIHPQTNNKAIISDKNQGFDKKINYIYKKNNCT